MSKLLIKHCEKWATKEFYAHGFRSIASTALNENEFNVEIIEALLSHVKGDKVRTAYDHPAHTAKATIY